MLLESKFPLQQILLLFIIFILLIIFLLLINTIMQANNENKLYSEFHRLKTFENRWPLTFIDAKLLAQTGMYYTGITDTVKCYFCEVEISQWKKSDHPVNEHYRWSRNCPLLRRRKTNNLPLDRHELNAVLPLPSYDICGNMGVIENRPNAYAESPISNTWNTNNNTRNINNNNNIQDSNQRYPQYKSLLKRLGTYLEWPVALKQTPLVLSEAGFFYTGIGDRVKCFYCGGEFKGWKPNDDPWQVHTLYFNRCGYVVSRADIHTNNTAADADGNTAAADADGINNTTTDQQFCKVCYIDNLNTAFLPCGHVVACIKCAQSIETCPICREPFDDIIKVYFS